MLGIKSIGAWAIVSACAVAGALAMANTWQDPDDEAIQRRDLMRTKLMYSQNIVEGLATKNFQLIHDGAQEIESVMRVVLLGPTDNAEYKRLAQELKVATGNLTRAADSGNLEAATLRYFDMTMRCIDCHEFLRKADF